MVVMCAAALIAGCASVPTAEDLARADFGPRPDNYEELIKAHFFTSLIDPTSPLYQFREPVKVWSGGALGREREYGWTVCGQLNAKNRMGGYTGWVPFYVAIRHGQIRSSSIGEAEFGSVPSFKNAFIGGRCRSFYGDQRVD